MSTETPSGTSNLEKEPEKLPNESEAVSVKKANGDNFKTPVIINFKSQKFQKPKQIEDVAVGEEAQDSASSLSDAGSGDGESGGKGGFLPPMSLPPGSKSGVKKEADKKPSPVSMSFRSKFAVPADIYKAPRIAAFMTEQPLKSKVKKEPKSEESSDAATDQPSSSKPKPPVAKLNYQAPEWSGDPPENTYSFEILKMGAIVGNISLSKKSFFVVGRLADCHIKMEHPSISRYHAIVQYGAPGPDCADVELQKDGSPGFYVYDLGSTHGTVINKSAVSSKTYYRIKVGHVVKFGGSTRLYILQGPSEDQEEEAKETATELRKLNREKIKKKKDLEKMMLGDDSSSDEDDDNKNSRSRQNAEGGGISWGMLEDAVQGSSDEEKEEEEEEGDPTNLHPDAVAVHIQVKKDPFYVKDPMKALKTLFEREKLDLDFECTEKRSGHWHVRLSLPVDSPGGKPVYAEASATGKKKDTINHCALDACRILERHGMFHHTDHNKQKAKQWEKDDFYDSDEDEFNDRTGELQRKRSMRMKRVGKTSKIPKVIETYDSLCKKVKDLENELQGIEAKLHKDKEVTKMNVDVVDPLDAFMQQVKSGKALDTTTRAKLKYRFFEAKKELIQASKLAEVARPSSLPPLTSSYTKTYSFIGKMRGKKKATLNFARTIQQPEILAGGTDENVVEEEEEEKEEQDPVEKKVEKQSSIDNHAQPEGIRKTSSVKEEKFENPILDDNLRTTKSSSSLTENPISMTEQTVESVNIKCNNVASEPEKPSRKRTMGPTLPPELRERLLSDQDKPDNDGVDEEAVDPKKRKKRIRKPKPQHVKAMKPNVQYSDDPNFCTWLPPEDQSGDGKTSLNEKLGY